MLRCNAAAGSVLRACGGSAQSIQNRPAAAAAERISIKDACRRLALQLPLECSLDNPEVTEVRRAVEARCSSVGLPALGERGAGRGSQVISPWATLAAPERVVYRVE